MHRNWKWKESQSPTCPLCSIHPETCDHVLKCQCVQASTFRKSAIKNLRKSLSVLQTRPLLLNHIIRSIHQWVAGLTPKKIPMEALPDHDQDVAIAFNEQLDLGVSNMLRGILTYKINDCQIKYYASLPDKRNGDGSSWSKQLISHLINFSISIWKFRCDQVQESKIFTAEGRMRNECRKLYTEIRTNKSIIPASFRYLLQKDYKFFSRGSIQSIKSWLRRINIGIKQQEHQSSKNHDIRTWLTKKIPLSETDEESTDSDATKLWYDKYPDEHPDLRTWDLTHTDDFDITVNPNVLIPPYIQYQNSENIG